MVSGGTGGKVGWDGAVGAGGEGRGDGGSWEIGVGGEGLSGVG